MTFTSNHFFYFTRALDCIASRQWLNFLSRKDSITKSLLNYEKMVYKSKTDLKFSKFLKSKWLTDVKDYELKKRTIVVNISNTDATVSGPEPRKVLQPRKSTILEGNTTSFLGFIRGSIHEKH